MSRMTDRMFAGLGALALAMAAPTIATAQTAGPNEPVLTGSYGWEDGEATIFGSNAPNNITAVNVDDFVHSGERALRVTESPHSSGAVHLYIGHIRDLEHGDIIRASFWTYDDVPDSQPRVRIWAHYTIGDSISPVAQAGGNLAYSQGIGWEELSNEWTFNAFTGNCNGNCDGLVIQARIYSAPNNCDECSSDYWFDDLSVEVYCAADPNLSINFPDGSIVDDPLLPGDPCEPADDPLECDTEFVVAGYGWEDEEGTIIGTNVPGNITAVNQGDFVYSGNRAVKVTESPHATGTPQIFLAHVRNLTDGDFVTGSFVTWDDTPGQHPRVRIWAHYTSGSNLASVPPAFPVNEQNQTYTSGIGWEELSNTWVFDSNNGARDGILIHARIFSATCNEDHPGYDPGTGHCATDYFFDDVNVEVCAANPQNVIILFPDSFSHDPEPPIEVCDEPMTGYYGWEDGEGTYINASSSTISGTNITADEGPVLDERGLRITESPNATTNPDVRLTFIENLEHGDVIRASFWTYDDTPGEHPRVRIWARRGFSGEPFFLGGSAGGNEDWSSPGGWVKREHVWEFDEGTGQNPYDALMVMARVYAPPCNESHPAWDPEIEDCPTASTDYFVDDLLVEVCSEHPNVTITLPDGSIIGDPGEPQDCIADVDGSGTVDIFDVFAVLGAWGTADPNADVNGDGLVDGADLGIVLASFGPCSEFLFPMPGSAKLLLEDTAGPGGLRQYDLFVELKSGQSLVNVYDGDVNSSLGFEGGSFITIGVDFEHPDIAEDPNFDFSEFNNGTSLGTNAGWYNFDPSNDLGLADLYPDFRVLIARFFIDPDSEFDAELSVSYEDANGRARQATLALEPDATPCPGDLTGNGSVGVPDLLALLACWGPVTPGSDCENADLTGSGAVGVPDLLELLSQWGPCPR